MFLQQGPAETTNYMILGFALIFIPMLIHLWSIYIRNKNLEQDLALMEELEE
jgi:hypothetical protein